MNKTAVREKLARLARQNSDFVTTLSFTLAMALLALALAPDQGAMDIFGDDWFLGEEAGVRPEVVFEPTVKELELDLPFEQVDEISAQATEETSQGQLPPGWSTYTIKKNDIMGTILKEITQDEEARQFLVTQKMSSYQKLRPGTDLRYKIGADGRLEALAYKTSPELHLNFTRDASGAMLVAESVPTLSARTVVSSAEITPDNNSLFAASDDANVPDAIIQKTIDALETRIDFARDTRLEDSFSLVYEVLHDADGEYAGPGELLGLLFTNEDTTHVGLFNSEDGAYYTPEGESLQRAFLRSPLKFTRVSSRYSLRRFHPVLKKWRPHRGVDFAAPTNTPVRSAADGTIEFIGKKGGYGNVIMVRHFGEYLTVYGHLNKFAKGLKKGSGVEHGQVIGYVGSTGLATGPHLHYEFRIDGEHVDPLSVDVPTTRPSLEGPALAKFRESTEEVRTMLVRDVEQGFSS